MVPRLIHNYLTNSLPFLKSVLKSSSIMRYVARNANTLTNHNTEDFPGSDITSFDARNHDEKECSVNQDLDRGLPKTDEEFRARKNLPTLCPFNSKSLTVAVIGMPNAGKSTLVNQLVGTRISSISKKVHTTRRNIVGIMQEDSTQIVFMDTPGLVTSHHCQKHSLEQTFISHPDQGLRISDMILVVVDASNKRDQHGLNPGVIEKLKKNKGKTSALVINKVDAIGSKRRLIDISTRLSQCHINAEKLPGISAGEYLTPPTEVQEHRRFDNVEARVRKKGHIVDIEGIVNKVDEPEVGNNEEGWKNFDHVFMVSALDGNGVEELKNYLMSKAMPRSWSYHPSLITPLAPSQIVYNTVREKLLENLPEEIPYKISLQIQSWDVSRSGNLSICMDLYSPKSRYMSIIIGPRGKCIQKISFDSRTALSDAFKTDVVIQLVVNDRDKKSQIRKDVHKQIVKNK